MRIQYIKLELVYQLSKTLLSYCMVVKQKINTHTYKTDRRETVFKLAHANQVKHKLIFYYYYCKTLSLFVTANVNNKNNILNKAKHRYRYVSVVVINKSLIIIV